MLACKMLAQKKQDAGGDLFSVDEGEQPDPKTTTALRLAPVGLICQLGWSYKGGNRNVNSPSGGTHGNF